MKRFLKTVAYVAAVHVMALVVFSLFRLLQYLLLGDMMIADKGASVVTALVKGVWFDNVIACYVGVLPVAVLLIAAAFGFFRRWLLVAAGWWYGVMFGVAFMPSAANIPYFHYFFKNINSSIFEWFGYAGTTTGMLLQEKSWWIFIALYVFMVFVFVMGLVGLYWLLEPSLFGRQDVNSGMDKGNDSSSCRKDKAGDENGARCVARQKAVAVGMRLVVALAVVGACVFGIRGRMGYNPIKVSQAYYCEDAFLNQLGINPAFNLLTSVLDDMRKENRELHLMSYGEAVGNTRRWLGITGTVDSACVLRRVVVNDSPDVKCRMGEMSAPRHPNVVVILMESMSASLMGTFGNNARLTPTLDSLYRHSLAFDNFYSAGIHTNHGMTATLYSFPAIMFRNLMKGTVTPHRRGIATVLKACGYDNMFFMTHEAQYDNMKAFFATNGYDEIYSQESYPKSEVVNSFGVSDHFLFSYALNTINRKAASGKPFFSTILTISNHPPYIVPSWFKPRSKDKEQQIVEYADWCVGDFLRKAAREPWFKNTIFVIQADHGKIVAGSGGELPQSLNHIPLIMFGPDVPQKRYEGLGMQVDVMPTLLGLMHLDYTFDGFGVDLLKTTRPMVFYSADNQLVARDAKRCFIYEPAIKKSFCYDVLPDGSLRENRRTALFDDLRRYVFSNIQTAEFIERHKDLNFNAKK